MYKKDLTFCKNPLLLSIGSTVTEFAPPAVLLIMWASADMLVEHVDVLWELSGQACVRVYGRKRKQTIGWLCHTNQSACFADVFFCTFTFFRLPCMTISSRPRCDLDTRSCERGCFLLSQEDHHATSMVSSTCAAHPSNYSA